MRKISFTFIAIAIFAVLAANPASADFASTLHVSLDAGDGKTIDLTLHEGGTVRISNDKEGFDYILRGTMLESGDAELTVHTFADGVVDRQHEVARSVVAIDGEMRQLAGTDLNLAIMGVTVEKRQARSAEPVTGGVATRAECCINCGDYRICCTPPPGWKCTLTCLNTSETCSATTPIFEE